MTTNYVFSLVFISVSPWFTEYMEKEVVELIIPFPVHRSADHKDLHLKLIIKTTRSLPEILEFEFNAGIM